MLPSVEDTIAAIASPPGGGLRGIIRVSGPRTVPCLAGCFQSADHLPLARIRAARVVPGQLGTPPPVGPLPVDLYLWPGARSYTRQPTAELHTIGSPPLLEAALETLCAAGARPARPGEFTLRAFLAGRLDLPQAEAVLGVIDARDERQLQTALAQLAGGLSRPLAQLRDHLLDLLADLEANLDFADEDLPPLDTEQLVGRLAAARSTVRQLLARMTRRGVAAGMPRVVLRGWPNTGKSSLLNALAGTDAAIVSDTPGTTRDYVTQRVDLGGVECLLIDTAGVHPALLPGTIETAMQEATRQQHQQASLELLCLDSTRPLNAWERAELAAAQHVDRLLVLTRCDRPRASDLDQPAVATSSRTGEGLDALRQAVARQLARDASQEPDVVAETATRCRDSLRHASAALRRAQRLAATSGGGELLAAETRHALEQLGRVAGHIYTDDLLDRVFSRFCIGK